MPNYYIPMFSLFKRKDPLEKLQKEYRDLLQRSYELSTSNRAEGDKTMAKAQEILKEIETLEKNGKEQG